MARVEHEPGFVLHRRRYRETSLLLEVMTRDNGRVGLMAKGARRAKSRTLGTLEPFQALLLSWAGRGELGTLTSAELPRPAVPLSGERLISGLYLNELFYRLCGRHDPYPELFGAYELALAALRSAPEYEGELRVFEKRLLEALGYGLLLTRAADTDAPVSQGLHYQYHPESGAVATVPGSSSRAGYPEVSGDTLLALAREELTSDSQRREAKILMRATLQRYLGERPVASREMFRRHPGR